MTALVSVLLVDDSVVIRGALKRLLEADKDIQIVGTARDGQQGVEAAAQHKPDVVILDIEMPVKDGLTALPEVLKSSPHSKVIMFSSLTEKGADVTLKALSLGATECMAKPSADQDVGPGSDFERQLLRLVKGLGRLVHVAKQTSAVTTSTQPISAQSSLQLHNDPAAYKGIPALVAIGSSTGGPNALFEVCASFKDFSVPIIITQHMPAKFTTILAQHIGEKTGIKTHEGEDGMVLENGHIYVAPGGLHMLIKKEDGKNVIRLDDGPAVNFCKPSVDPMIQSAVEIYGNRVLGVILTGMGNDGLDGCKAIVGASGRVIAQDEATSTVWGMPRAVAEAGICSNILPLTEVGPWVRQQVIG